MNRLEFDAGELSKEKIHELLASQMSFPEWYGKNLDALYDCLGDVSEDWTIAVRNSRELSQGIAMVLSDAAQENSHLTLRLL